MLDKILNNEIDSINKKVEADINSLKYIANLVKNDYNSFRNKFFRGSEEIMYKELKERVSELYAIYRLGYESGFVSGRPEKNIERSVLLGFEKISGSEEGVLDGRYDSGKSLNLTQKGKAILDGYRLSRGELPLDKYNKYILKEFNSLSDYLF